jgi:hypothetical protein
VVKEQYQRIVSAVEYTLSQMRDGPKERGNRETGDAYEQRIELWYKHKHKFALFCIKCIRHADEHRATSYLHELRRIRQEM